MLILEPAALIAIAEIITNLSALIGLAQARLTGRARPAQLGITT